MNTVTDAWDAFIMAESIVSPSPPGAYRVDTVWAAIADLGVATV
jgi:hypothetical protein